MRRLRCNCGESRASAEAYSKRSDGIIGVDDDTDRRLQQRSAGSFEQRTTEGAGFPGMRDQRGGA